MHYDYDCDNDKKQDTKSVLEFMTCPALNLQYGISTKDLKKGVHTYLFFLRIFVVFRRKCAVFKVQDFAFYSKKCFCLTSYLYIVSITINSIWFYFFRDPRFLFTLVTRFYDSMVRYCLVNNTPLFPRGEVIKEVS